MAKNLEGTASFSGNYKIKIWHRVSQLSQSIADNTSKIRVQLWFGTDDPYTSASRYGITTTIPVTMEGQTKNLTLGNYNIANSWQDIGYVDFVIPHTANGAKNISFSYSCDIGTISGYNIGSASFSGNFYPDTIPRASSISLVSVSELGKPVTVTINRKAGFTHQLWYRINGGSWVDVGTGYATSCIFTPPISTCSSNTKSLKNTLDVSLRTISGSTQVGDDVYSNGWTIWTPENAVAPTLGTFTIKEMAAAVAGMLFDTPKTYLQSMSQMQLTQSTATAKYGATIVDHLLWIDDAEVKAKTGTMTPTKSGSLEVWYGARDSRGITKWDKEIVTVLPYAIPAISRFTAARSGGGTSVKVVVNFAGTVKEVKTTSQKNYGEVGIYYRKTGATSWQRCHWLTSPETLAGGVVPFKMTGVVLSPDFDIEQSFDIKASIWDTAGKMSESIVTISTAFVVMAWGKKNVGIGRIPEDGYTLDVNGTARIRGNPNAMVMQGQEYTYTRFMAGQKDVGYIGAWPTYLRLRNYKSGKSLDLQDDNYMRYDGPAWFDDLWIGNKKLGDLGDYLWGTGGQGVALNGSNWKTHRTLTLTKGTWIIDCGYNVDGQSGKYLSYRVSGVPNIALGGELYCQDGYEHISTASAVVTVSASATLTLQAWTSNGMTAVKNHYLQATKITG